MKVFQKKLLSTPGAEVIISKAALAFKCLFSDSARIGSQGELIVSGKKSRAVPKEFGKVTGFKNVEIFL